MELSRETIARIRGLISFAAFLILCLWKYDDVLAVFSYIFRILAPFVLGGMISFLLNVPMSYIEEKLISRGKKQVCGRKPARVISMMCVLAVLLTILFLFIFLMIPTLGKTVGMLEYRLGETLTQVEGWIEERFSWNPMVQRWLDQGIFSRTNIMDTIQSLFGNGVGKGGRSEMLSSAVAVIKEAGRAISTIGIAFAFAIYVLLQKEKLKCQAKKVLFAFVRRGRAEAVVEVCTLAYRTCAGYLTGQCMESVILGAMFAITMLIFRLPYALLISIVISFFALIPIFGAFIGCAVGICLIFITEPEKVIVFIILFFVLQQIEGNLIYPHVVGNSVGLPPIWVLVAVSIGGSLMGVVGMVIFIPIVSVAYALFREIVYLKLKQQGVNPNDI